MAGSKKCRRDVSTKTRIRWPSNTCERGLNRPTSSELCSSRPAGPDASGAAGIAGIAVQAGHCLIVERAEMIAAADRAGLFVIGVAGR